MQRFDYDEDDEENLFPDTGEGQEMDVQEYITMLEKNEAVEFAQLQLVQIDINHRLLRTALRSLEKSWFWNFRGQQTKLTMLIEYYHVLKQLVTLEFNEGEANAKI